MLQFSANRNTENGHSVIDIAGGCNAMRMIRDHILLIAPTSCSVLIIGDVGTGKSLIARKIHNLSARNHKPLIHFSCSTLKETYIKPKLSCIKNDPTINNDPLSFDYLSTLDGATLILDRIDELTQNMQLCLLEALETIELQAHEKKNIDLRLIITANKDLRTLAANNQFNEHLYYYLSTFNIYIPPLRDRKLDIVELTNNLLQEISSKYNKQVPFIDDNALNILKDYAWPGNYRELKNTIERAVIIATTNKITIDMLMLDPTNIMHNHTKHLEPSYQPLPNTRIRDTTDNLSLEDYFQYFVLEHQDGMTETELAQKLGISRKCLWERRQKYNIPRCKKATDAK